MIERRPSSATTRPAQPDPKAAPGESAIRLFARYRRPGWTQWNHGEVLA